MVSGAAGCLFCHLAPRAGVKRSRGGGAGGAGCPWRKSQRGLSIATAACPGQARGLPCTQGAAASPKRPRVLHQSRAGAHGGVLARCPCTPPHHSLPLKNKNQEGRLVGRLLLVARSGAIFTSFFPVSFSQPSCFSMKQHRTWGGGCGGEARSPAPPPQLPRAGAGSSCRLIFPFVMPTSDWRGVAAELPGVPVMGWGGGLGPNATKPWGSAPPPSPPRLEVVHSLGAAGRVTRSCWGCVQGLAPGRFYF